MNKKQYEELLSYIISSGVEFAELYYEEKSMKNFILNDSKLEDIKGNNTKGIGIRVFHNDNCYYAATNNLKMTNIKKEIDILLSNIQNKNKQEKKIKLNNEEILYPQVKIEHNDYPIKDKIKLLKAIDKEVRDYSKYINQVRVGIYEADKKYTITNSNGLYKTSKEIVTRVYCVPYAKKGDIMEDTFSSFGMGCGYECLDNFNYKDFANDLAEVAVKKLSAKKFKGGKVPVVIGPGFGAVIFHEACGHALEATAVADSLSVLSNKLNKVVGSEKVTLIDDGTIENEWGSSIIDSEGTKTQKNILIEKGVLKSYLVDMFNSKKMNHPLTGSSRRESYLYPPTSRMNNTYLDKGNDKIEDMIKSIDYGIYCKSMRGGSVDPKTGDFNFSVDESYLIEKGKITDMLTGITLIGKGQEILKEVEMVSDDLSLGTGYCGSISGNIHVTIGEPTIKVSNILVGGSE